MGLVLDSSVLIAAEREARPISDLLTSIQQKFGQQDVLMSAISVVELEHGLWRAKDPAIRERRREYLDEIFAILPVLSFDKDMAKLAARIDAETRPVGITIPFADLQIGATALSVGYAVATANARHFGLIPNLVVKQL